MCPADVAELVARGAGGLGTCKNDLAAAHVALADEGKDLLDPLPLFRQIDIDEGVEFLGLLLAPTPAGGRFAV